jgi:hypothetical protein
VLLITLDLGSDTPKEPKKASSGRLVLGLNAPKEAKESLIDRTQFGVAHALQLLRLKDMPDKQVELAKEFAVKFMAVQQSVGRSEISLRRFTTTLKKECLKRKLRLCCLRLRKCWNQWS